MSTILSAKSRTTVVPFGDFPRLVMELRSFLGADRLKEQIKCHLDRESSGNQMMVYRLRENQPLIDGFIEYDKKTLGGNRPIKAMDTPQLELLASVGLLCRVVSPTLSEAARKHHIGFLLSLDGNLFPMLVEWQVAQFYIARFGAKLEWISGKGPEFVARAEGLEWEVECKRISANISELLREGDSDRLAGCIATEVHRKTLGGEITIRVPDGKEKSINESALELLRREIESAAVEGSFQLESATGLSIEGDLRPHTDDTIDVSAFQKLPATKNTFESRSYGFASARNGRAANPVIVRITGPRRMGEAFLDHLWTRKFEHAAKQCSGDRGAVLVFEWSSILSPNVFAESEQIQALIARTFSEHPHVATIVLRTGPLRREGAGYVNTHTEAYIARSSVTKFPEIAGLDQFDDPIQPTSD